MKPLPPNLDKQLQVLEKQWQKKHQERESKIEQDVQSKFELEGRKMQQEAERRKLEQRLTMIKNMQM